MTVQIKALPPLEKLLALFHVDVVSGNLLRLTQPSNNVRIGSIAGRLTNDGYIHVKVDDKAYFAHRIVWYLHHSVDPRNSQIDHINHNRADNRPSNLRVCTHEENQRNRIGATAISKSGERGVWWDSSKQKWKVRVIKDGHTCYAGLFTELTEAVLIAKGQRAKYFGEYAGQ